MVVPFLKPSFPDSQQLAEAYEAILARGVYTNGGPFAVELEECIGKWIGNGVVAAVVSSGTTGLMLAIRSTFLPDRSVAIVPSFTFAAGPLAIRWCGFQPLFVDVEEESWQPQLDDAISVLSHSETRVAGILLTTTFGVANKRVAEWEELADRHGIPLVIDSAAGLGSQYDWGEPLGARGTCEVFSLHATKTVAVGEGGAVVTRSHELKKEIDQLKNFGFDVNRSTTMLGLNAKMSEFEAAVGIYQLNRLSSRLARRRAIFQHYVDCLAPLGVRFQPASEGSALPFVSALMPSNEARDSLRNDLEQHGVECRIYYNPPMHHHALFLDSQLVHSRLPVTDKLARQMLSLPMADGLEVAVIDQIAAVARTNLS